MIIVTLKNPKETVLISDVNGVAYEFTSEDLISALSLFLNTIKEMEGD